MKAIGKSLGTALLSLYPLSAAPMEWRVDPVTRYVRISYQVPQSAPPVISVHCEVRRDGDPEWRPAAVLPYISETAMSLLPAADWEDGMVRGVVTERLANGLTRAVVWNPFPLDAARFSGAFRLRLLDGKTILASHETAIHFDNSDVVVIDDWSKVLQNSAVAENPAGGAAWWYRTGQRGPGAPFRGTSLEVKEKHRELPQLTYPLDLGGWYAIFVTLPAKLGAIELRLTGDPVPQIFREDQAGREAFWRWADMRRQHLVVRQPYFTVHEYEDEFRAHLDTVRLVPLNEATVRALDRRWARTGGKRLVAAYNEPYSWAFFEKVESPLQHWEPLLMYAEAGADIIDTQFGRGGSKMVFETRTGDQLLGETVGDPVRGKDPRTGNVGRMQQFTNMLAAQMDYARRLGLKFHANLGATNCYPGTLLEADLSRRHPEWRTRSYWKYEVPEVRRAVLALYREALEIGADALTIDWCRYPYSLTSKDTVTTFFRELRALADEYGRRKGRHIEILTRFPARGVPGWEHMDYRAWAREGLVDFLAPSNIQGRHMHFDVAEYVQGAKGTKTRVLPAVDGLGWGLPWPGMMFQRILKCYQAGADGVYIYQADRPILRWAGTRRYLSMVGSWDALRQWQEQEDAEQGRYSKGVYWTPASAWTPTGPSGSDVYHPYLRMRIWVEGFQPDKLELLVDGKLMNRYTEPPFILTSEDRSHDRAIPPGRHSIRVRAEQHGRWLEREFEAEFAK